jgi:predicted DNA-binding transcriptional regulator AlpA
MTESEKYIPAAAVKRMFGGVSDMWLWRRLADPASGFPQPIYVGGRRFWREVDLLAWVAAQPTAGDRAA